METNDTADRLPWEPPTATALTDTESRADQADVWMTNGAPPFPSGPG